VFLVPAQELARQELARQELPEQELVRPELAQARWPGLAEESGLQERALEQEAAQREQGPAWAPQQVWHCGKDCSLRVPQHYCQVQESVRFLFGRLGTQLQEQELVGWQQRVLPRER
jgi:hypothetical protein